MKKRLGQVWSLDIILGFVVLVLIISIFYVMLNNTKNPFTETLEVQASTIAGILDTSSGFNSPFAIMDKGTIDSSKIVTLYESDYRLLKNQFGIRGDFCIYIVDQYNNLIVIDTVNGPMNGFGNGNLTINNKPCGSSMN
jgi:hypothetical protein